MRNSLYPNLFRSIALTAVLLLTGSQTLLAQTGTIRGQVMDGEFNEPLIGATVLLEGSSLGANTDIDGQFSLNNVPVGTYTLKISYISYQTLTITEVEVAAGKVTVVEPVLQPEGAEVGEVVITAKALAVSESSLLNIQIKAAQTLDGLGSRQIGRIGDSDAGGAIRRVVGVSVEGGKYVYVRGLGDRYGKTLVNGAEIPGLDPTRNSVQIDLFPTAVLDNMLIYKSFTPDLPGSFTGGLVDINTRDFPDTYSLQISVSTSYNTQSTFNSDWQTYEGSSSDFLGFGFKDRDVPGFVSANQGLLSGPPNGISDSASFNEANRAFGDQWFSESASAPLDHSLSFSLGNQTTLFGKAFGYILSGSYRRQYTYNEGSSGVFNRNPGFSNTELFDQQDFADTRSGNEVLWSVLANGSLKFNDRNKLSLSFIRTQSGESNTRFLDGLKREAGDERYQEIRVLDYNQRSNTIGQLRGNHVIGENAWAIDWIISGAFTQNYQPDFRTWAYQYTLLPNGSRDIYTIDGSTTGAPTRFFRELDETNVDSKFHITRFFKSWTGDEGKFKFGAAWLDRIGRKFSERQYNILTDVPTSGARSLDSFRDNLPGFFDVNGNGQYTPSSSDNGLFYNFIPNFVNDYTASETVYAAYGMFDLNVLPKLRLVTGVRLETTDIEVVPDESATTDGGDAKVDQSDLLPALNLIYSLSEKANLRLNYGKTIARPVFREIAPFNQYDFFAGPRTVGNQSLDRSLIDSFDFRYEFYPSTAELFALSAYYKIISQPIEKAFIDDASGTTITWQNVDEAIVYGLELDVRKNLSFINPALNRLQLSINASYTFSEVNVPAEELANARLIDPNAPTTRELFGQSPYLINASLSYLHELTGTSYSIAFNQFGERLILVASPGTPNYYEQPRASLDINIQQRLGGEDGNWMLRIGAQNLLNPEVRWTSDFNGREYDWVNYKEGTRITLGASYTFSR
jgi:TonB-dependent receptor